MTGSSAHVATVRTHQVEARSRRLAERRRGSVVAPVQPGGAIGPISLAQRTWVPAMVPWRATDDGFVTQDVLDWYERFARGKPGAIVVEATGIRDIPSGPLAAHRP